MSLVLVLSGGREGSSMITSIIANHGYWTGTYTNRSGYADFENVEIYNFLRSHWPAPTTNPGKPKADVSLRKFVERLLPDGPAVIKTMTNMYDVWSDAFPDASYLIARRDENSVVHSALKRRGGGDVEESLRIVRERHEIMDRVAEERGLVIVDTAEVVSGNYDKLRVAMKDCGIEMNSSVVDKTVNPDLWKS